MSYETSACLRIPTRNVHAIRTLNTHVTVPLDRKRKTRTVLKYILYCLFIHTPNIHTAPLSVYIITRPVGPESAWRHTFEWITGSKMCRPFTGTRLLYVTYTEICTCNLYTETTRTLRNDMQTTRVFTCFYNHHCFNR